MSGIARMDIPVYPPGTGAIVEGTPDQLFPLAREPHEAVASQAGRVVTMMRSDDRRDTTI